MKERKGGGSLEADQTLGTKVNNISMQVRKKYLYVSIDSLLCLSSLSYSQQSNGKVLKQISHQLARNIKMYW